MQCGACMHAYETNLQSAKARATHAQHKMLGASLPNATAADQEVANTETVCTSDADAVGSDKSMSHTAMPSCKHKTNGNTNANLQHNAQT